MREIKFRAWNKELKEMISGEKLTYFEIFISPANGNLIEVKHLENYLMGHISLMQFTGLKDKNGKEIYEGDVVETFNSKRKKLIAGIWKVIFSEHLGCFDGERISYRQEDSGEDFECIGNLVNDKCKVIGNIYENPEILSNSSLPVRTSDKSDSANAEEFNKDLKEVQK